jgi:DNA (cytosine-5)-methyltransferase 1
VKVLNLYACLGGNRYKWDEVADIQVTAVELDPEAARLYQERFPSDTVIIGDAHQYLLDHYKEYDFIWSSPPCPTHSKARHARRETTKPVYPDMCLYQQVIFLQHNFNGKYVIENVVPYYQPLVEGQKRGRHIYWANFVLPYDLGERGVGIMAGKDEVTAWSEFHDYDFRKYKGEQRLDKMARNLVDYEVGKTILQTALNIESEKIDDQFSLFI